MILSLEFTDVVSVIKCIKDIGWEGLKIVDPRSRRIFTSHFVQTSFRSIWNPCLWLATKQFWPISSICSPGLMQLIVSRRKRCAVKCGKDGSLLSIHVTERKWGYGQPSANWKWRKNWLRKLFQLKILRTGSLLCSWTNGICTTLLYIYNVETLPLPRKSVLCVFNWSKSLFLLVILWRHQNSKLEIFDSTEILSSWSVREAKKVLWYTLEFLSFCVARHLRASRESCHVG